MECEGTVLFEMVKESQGSDPQALILATIALVVILALLWVFREKRKRNKHDYEKRDPENPKNWWGFPFGDPDGAPKSG